MEASICLCMMVKDESAVIRRALESALPYVDSWCITDTGSTDDTVAIIMATMQDLPGKVVTAPWTNFGINRTDAFREARALGSDYILMMDADQTLEVRDSVALDGPGADAYNLTVQHGPVSYPHLWLLRASLGWEWVGATHEYVVLDGEYTALDAPGMVLHEHADSSRRASGRKMKEDRALLEDAYANDPTDPRVVFYLAQTCMDEAKVACAIKHYRHRVEMGGWADEVYISLLNIGKLEARRGNAPACIMALLEACNTDPQRAEAFYYLGTAYALQKKPGIAHLFLREASQWHLNPAKLFSENWIYTHGAKLSWAVSCRNLGLHAEAALVENVLLSDVDVPYEVKSTIKKYREEHEGVPIA